MQLIDAEKYNGNCLSSFKKNKQFFKTLSMEIPRKAVRDRKALLKERARLQVAVSPMPHAEGNIKLDANETIMDRAMSVLRTVNCRRYDSDSTLVIQSVFCLTAHMRVIEIAKPGPPDVLRPAERSIPQVQKGEVLIRVHAAGINRPDVLQRLGHYPPPPGAPDIPGLEVAGEIVDGDLEGSGFQRGDRVCALLQGGGYAEYCAAPIGQCLPVPEGWSDIEAGSLPETFFTVWSNVFDRAGLRAGETLLVQGGTSGIGVTAIQLAHALGHRVFATAGTDEKCRHCEVLGAERGINYKREDFTEVVKQVTGGKGVDVILDMVAGDYIPRELECLADDGRLVIIALLGGAKATVDAGQILRRRLTLTGSTLRARPIAFKTAIAANLRSQVWPLLEARKIRPVIHRVFPLAQAAEAHALMESGTHVGKIVLQVNA